MTSSISRLWQHGGHSGRRKAAPTAPAVPQSTRPMAVTGQYVSAIPRGPQGVLAVAVEAAPPPGPAAEPLPRHTREPEYADPASPYQVGALMLADHPEWAYIPEHAAGRPPTEAEAARYADRPANPDWAWLYDLVNGRPVTEEPAALEPLPEPAVDPETAAQMASTAVLARWAPGEELPLPVPEDAPEAEPGTEEELPAEVADEAPAPVAEVSAEPSGEPQEDDKGEQE